MQDNTQDKKKITIVTHSSGFHTDDIFAAATLLVLLEKEHEVIIVRSRDMSVIEKADYVFDVGGIYDPSTHRFDHHQEGGAGKRENGVPYAAFGLVWNEYGEKISGSLGVKEKIDCALVQPIDAGDNGVQFLETKIKGLRPFDVGLITSLYSPTWKEETENINDIFVKLVYYAKELLQRVIISMKDREEGEKHVLEAYENSEDKRLVILDNSRYPWGEVLSGLPEPIFVVYKNITDETWSIKGVRSDLFSFTPRKKLPEAWAGKTGEQLEKITGVAGSVFCHNARFMAVAKTKEGVLQMAQIALNS